jgi:major membrane immunogen (membrane-anchored lipoprotein)
MDDPPGLPSVWYPQLEAQYLATDIENWNPENIDGISGATSTSGKSRSLFGLIVDAAKDGDTSTQIYTAE